jgi:hypothetical protein
MVICSEINQARTVRRPPGEFASKSKWNAPIEFFATERRANSTDLL